MNHQFGFRNRYNTLQEGLRLTVGKVEHINSHKNGFLATENAFDIKVWHKGHYKIKDIQYKNFQQQQQWYHKVPC